MGKKIQITILYELTFELKNCNYNNKFNENNIYYKVPSEILVYSVDSFLCHEESLHFSVCR